MIVYARILLYILAGWLSTNGWLNAELQTMLTTSDDAALAIQAVLSGAVAGVSWAWWRLAKRWGWAT